MKRSEEKIHVLLNKKIDPVYSKLAEKIGESDSKIMPHIFEALVSVEQAKILYEVPTSLEEIAKMLDLELKTVEGYIQEMFEKGLLFPGRTGWHLTRSWGSMHDSVGASNPKWDNDDFYDLAFAKHKETDAKQFEQVKSGEVIRKQALLGSSQ
jgi:hypothetical protein